jgi:hypothetical protein
LLTDRSHATLLATSGEDSNSSSEPTSVLYQRSAVVSDKLKRREIPNSAKFRRARDPKMREVPLGLRAVWHLAPFGI